MDGGKSVNIGHHTDEGHDACFSNYSSCLQALDLDVDMESVKTEEASRRRATLM